MGIKCEKCGEIRDGYTRCKNCLSIKAKKYRKTKKGFFSIIYSSQKHNSKLRNHQKPNYTKEQLVCWIKAQKNFKKMWKLYKKSGFDTLLKPSCDRLDDTKPYAFDNIQLITFGENMDKEYMAHSKGTSNNKDHVTVNQYSMDGELLATYSSMHLAERSTGALQPNIHKVCNGARNSAGGFIWEYANEK